MFDSLEDEIRTTEGGRPTRTEQLVRFAGIAIASIVVFGALYLVVVALE